MNKKAVTVLVLSCLMILALYGPCLCQSTPVFVVYGEVYVDSFYTELASGNHTMMAVNLSNWKHGFSGVDADGKYSAVIIYFDGGNVVEEGDIIQVRAKLVSGDYIRYKNYTITSDDISEKKVKIDISLALIGIESKSWGAIKALLQVRD